MPPVPTLCTQTLWAMANNPEDDRRSTAVFLTSFWSLVPEMCSRQVIEGKAKVGGHQEEMIVSSPGLGEGRLGGFASTPPSP